MLYIIIRLVLAVAACAMAYVIFSYAQEDKRNSRRSRSSKREISIGLKTGAVFVLTLLVLYFIPIENLIVNFSTPSSAFKYNNSGEIMDIIEYDDCAFVIASTGDGKITTHVLPGEEGKWKLETVYNRRRDLTTLNYCMVERLYVPDSEKCFVIVSHSTNGNIADPPVNVTDNRGTKFNVVSYPDYLTFYYGFVENMDDDYVIRVDGENIEFK